jgi:hypothetical protein
MAYQRRSIQQQPIRIRPPLHPIMIDQRQPERNRPAELISSLLGVLLRSRGRVELGRVAPEAFPDHLAIEAHDKPDKGDEPNRALLALQNAAQATGGWVGGAASAVGSGATTAASTVLDGAKHLGTGVAGLMRPTERGRHAGDED